MNHEKWLITGLSSIVVVIMALIAALTLSLNWSLLAISTTLFVVMHPLIWLAWRCYWFWCQSIMQLTTYTQMLKEGEQNLHLKKSHKDNLLTELQNEVEALALVKSTQNAQSTSLSHLLSGMLDSWSVPVCLFDQQLKLTYRNSAMNEQLQQPMLVGSKATELGFTLENGQLSHPKFADNWQCQSINYLHLSEKHWLFSALDISQLLHKNQSVTQQNLIRVLGHELRNSLTPMSSMTDTLLGSEHLDEQRTRLVLTRIHQRSERLLSFVGQYSKLAQLPPPKIKWFNIHDVLAEATAMIDESNCEIDFKGNEQCFGDVEQITQVMINLLKNSQEACEHTTTKINFKAYYHQQEQVLELTDNGPGFANLSNVLTPFYTTKKHGSGIGLSLCAEIIRNHGGQLTVANQDIQGAKIFMSWPLAETET
ncbi:HAMP domain-containing sensor histidine kinase [Thalassotalea fonticola]|uniref:histidine kinase n=1 Tax=Thalassotalea fonticola TaxID=3065649 RepID=A0ABZ0GPY2_9GAMM|nr:HAMP domain-containing sensor histidine kinase [Colwelliaceae bacterium S1-1]